MTQRIALVTGGSRGLGKNAALKLAAKGTDILLTYHSNRQAALDVVAEIEQKGVKAAALALNVGDSTTFDAFASEVAQVLAQKWGRTTFDYLLNNAGIGLNAPFAETSEAQFDELMNIQFKGPFFPDPASTASPAGWGAYPQCLQRPGALCPAGLCGLRRDEGGDGGSDALSGERAGRTGDIGEHHRAGGH
ncbi:oxidoreductase [Klebsiella pneumoniae]|uniref:Oxidoreductase n=1 Tax=Klebsiella pneumoniae TaxID=573 RepID=A0A377ZZC0_KLEPN|nr:oxidoreductase [Klebsiella pneumoniae]